MSFRTYLPTVPELTREVVLLLAATVITAVLVSRIPALKALVRDGSLSSTD